MGYKAAKEGVKALLLSLNDKVLMDIAHEGRMDILIDRKIDAIKKSDKYLDRLTQYMS